MSRTPTHTPAHEGIPLSAVAAGERPAAILRLLDVAVVAIAAPVMLLIGVSAAGYLVGAGAWIVLRLAGLAVERYATQSRSVQQAVGLRMGFLLARLFLLAIAVILVRRDSGRDAGLTALIVIVFAYSLSMFVSILDRPRRTT